MFVQVDLTNVLINFEWDEHKISDDIGAVTTGGTIDIELPERRRVRRVSYIGGLPSRS